MINTILMDLGKIRETVTHNEDDSYTIFLNSRLSFELQRECYRHALSHILHDDLSADISATELEALRHEKKRRG